MKSASAGGVEKRKPSTKGTVQGKGSSPGRGEMAPFFSIFYRGINKVTKSQSRAEGLEEEEQEGGGGRSRERRTTDGGQSGGGGGERTAGNRKSAADKPPLPGKSAKGSVADGGRPSAKGSSSTGAPRSRSTADLHAAKAAAKEAGKEWRKDEDGPPPPQHSVVAKKVVSSAPSSPQTGFARRRWFGSSSKSQEPAAQMAPTGQQQQQHSPLPPMPPNGVQQHQHRHTNGVARHHSQQPQQQQPQSLSFAQRIKLHKGVRTGKIPVDALQQVYNRGDKEHKRGKKASSHGGGVYMSADDVRELQLHDPGHIAEALLALGDEQPRVARSTPKHAAVVEDPRRVHERQRRDCLYPEEVYEQMVHESLLVCDLLQSHLDECIAGVRAKSPTALSSPFTTPPGSPFMTRSTSLQPFPGASPIQRVTIAVSPMAQQANPTPSPRPSLPPFPTGQALSPPPEVRITRPSVGGSGGSARSTKSTVSSPRIQFVRW